MTLPKGSGGPGLDLLELRPPDRDLRAPLFGVVFGGREAIKHNPGLAHTIKVKLTVRMDAELPGTAREYRQVGRRP